MSAVRVMGQASRPARRREGLPLRALVSVGCVSVALFGGCFVLGRLARPSNALTAPGGASVRVESAAAAIPASLGSAPGIALAGEAAASAGVHLLVVHAVRLSAPSIATAARVSSEAAPATAPAAPSAPSTPQAIAVAAPVSSPAPAPSNTEGSPPSGAAGASGAHHPASGAGGENSFYNSG